MYVCIYLHLQTRPQVVSVATATDEPPKGDADDDVKDDNKGMYLSNYTQCDDCVL